MVLIHRLFWGLLWIVLCVATVQGEQETDTTTTTTTPWTLPVPLPVRIKAGERFLQYDANDPDETSPRKEHHHQQNLRHPSTISTESSETRILSSTNNSAAVEEEEHSDEVDLEHWKPPVPLPVRTKAGERMVRRHTH
jgi:hypothetical protein